MPMPVYFRAATQGRTPPAVLIIGHVTIWSYTTPLNIWQIQIRYQQEPTSLGQVKNRVNRQTLLNYDTICDECLSPSESCHASLDFIGIRTCRHDQEVTIVKHGSVENCKLSVCQSSVVHWGEPSRCVHWRIKCWDLPTDVEWTGGRVDGVKYLAVRVLVVY